MSLKYVAAYLMSSLSGVESPEASHVESILGSVGATVDKDIVNKLISEMQGKNINEVLLYSKSI
jgi:large subunit ribosomal protein LP2